MHLTPRQAREYGRLSFDVACDQTAESGHNALAIAVLDAAGRDGLTNAQLGAIVRGVVDGYVELWREQDPGGASNGH